MLNLQAKFVAIRGLGANMIAKGALNTKAQKADFNKLIVKNLELAGYPSNPLEDGSLEKYRLVKIDISKLVGLALEGSSLGTKDAGRCKNFWALGLMFWMYQRKTRAR